MSSISFGDFRLSEIGPQPLCDSEGMLSRPMEISIGTVQRLYFIRPLEKACIGLKNVLLDALMQMRADEAFYRGETDSLPDVALRWSEILNGSVNGEARATDALIDALKQYQPNDAPFHAQCFREMQVCIKMKLATLVNIFGSRTMVFARCNSIFESALASLEKTPQGYTIEQRDRDLERLRSAYVKVDELTVDFLARFEESRLHPANAPASSAEVRQVSEDVRQVAVATASIDRRVEDVQTTANRFDHRDLASRCDARRQRRDARIRLQDGAFAIVERAKRDPTLHQHAASGQFSMELCFTFHPYRTDLQALGIDSPKALRSLLNARAKRLYRERLKVADSIIADR